jgi:hypothetical protein
MFNLTYWVKHEGPVETIRIKGKVPWGADSFTDIEGKRWHAYGFFGHEGKNGTWAVPYEEVNSYFTDTSSGFGGCSSTASWCSDVVSQRWKPYYLEIIK